MYDRWIGPEIEGNRVARWHIFNPKIPIWVVFGLFILGPFDIFCGHLGYFIVIWYIFPHFGVL
jgi:hypothetical protein